MKVLAIQLKRIGDLILTTPALASLSAGGARISLLVDSGCASLLPAIAGLDEKLVYHKRSFNRQLWRRLRADGWDAVLDFTGNDRSAVMSWFSRARRRVTFEWVRARWWKRLVYNEYVDSAVRERHTCDHYCDLTRPLGMPICEPAQPTLELADETRRAAARLVAEVGIGGSYVVIHPGAARPEKYWGSRAWGETVAKLRSAGHSVIVTCGPDAREQQHARELMLSAEQLCSSDAPRMALLSPPNLLVFAAVIEAADAVLSCDTSTVHLAAAFRRPQITLFGPTNPFHWRPRHAHAIVLSAANPAGELTTFQPKMKGAPMERLTPPTVWAAAERLLPGGPSASASANRI
jgi:ADP-heptose:LPS heptosyltransferase